MSISPSSNFFGVSGSLTISNGTGYPVWSSISTDGTGTWTAISDQGWIYLSGGYARSASGLAGDAL